MVALCHALGITFLELIEQPAWWVDAYQLFLEGKGRSDREKMKARQTKSTHASRIRRFQ